MRSDRQPPVPARLLLPVLSLMCLFGPGGCILFRGNPSKANNDLRRQVQQLQGQVDTLRQQHDADGRALAAWQGRGTTLPTLPADRLASLFTVHGLKFGRLTGGARIHPGPPGARGDDGVKVYVTPTDDTGDALKAAGSFEVELVDLAGPEPVRIGKWDFTVGQARQLWGGSFLEKCYVLPCPWPGPPAHAGLTVRVQFTDELTRATFPAQREVKVELPTAGAAAPTTSAAAK